MEEIPPEAVQTFKSYIQKWRLYPNTLTEMIFSTMDDSSS